MEVLQRTANRGSISTGYDIDNSVKLEPDNAEYFQRPAAGSNGSLTTWTFSLWLKRTELSHNNIFYSQGGNGRVRFESNDTFSFRYKSGNELTTSRVFRDTSAWYHIVIAVDTTQATASNRVKIYFNGVQETMSGTQPALNATSDFGAFSTVTAQLGQFVEGAYYFAGYMADFYWIDGIQQAPTEFGEFDSDTGIWKPKAYTGSFGSEGVYLDFESSGSLGADSSGNGNNFTANNITAADQATDTPTNNFCTLNPLDNNWANVPTINEGATTHMLTSPGVWRGSSGTIAVSKGKWYWEIKTTNSGGNLYMLGIGSTEYGEVPGSQSPHDVLNFAGLYLANSATEGGLFVTDSTGGSVYRNAFNPGANHSANDIYGFALDLDSSPQTITFYRNGTNINPSSGAPLDIAGACSILPVTIRLSIFEREAQCNFGGYTEFSIASGNTDANEYGNFE